MPLWKTKSVGEGGMEFPNPSRDGFCKGDLSQLKHVKKIGARHKK
jgi:hypothetical protein